MRVVKAVLGGVLAVCTLPVLFVLLCMTLGLALVADSALGWVGQESL